MSRETQKAKRLAKQEDDAVRKRKAQMHLGNANSAMLGLTSNLLRSIRGGGLRARLGAQVLAVASELALASELDQGALFGFCFEPHKWWRPPIERGDPFRHDSIDDICKAALRIIAASMEDHHRDLAHAEGDMAKALAEWKASKEKP